MVLYYKIIYYSLCIYIYIYIYIWDDYYEEAAALHELLEQCIGKRFSGESRTLLTNGAPWERKKPWN